MSLDEQKAYKELTGYIDRCVETNSNGLILSLPGLGLTHTLKEYVAKHPKVAIYNNLNDSIDLHKYAIFDLPNISYEEIAIIEKLHKKMKMAIATGDPSMINDKQFILTSFRRHVYSVCYFKPVDFTYCKWKIETIDKKIDLEGKKRIYELSGGFPKLIKLLALNPDLLLRTKGDIRSDIRVRIIIEPIIDVLKKCSEEILQKMDLDKLDESLLFASDKDLPVKIKLLNDLGFEENGQISELRLTSTEARILSAMLANDNFISYEQVSDIKWGGTKYDSYSDQAIHKTMRRLNAKLRNYGIETISKVGFKILTK